MPRQTHARRSRENTRWRGPPNSWRMSFSRSRERHRRDVVAERGEAALQLVLLVLGKAVELDHRDHLADLHRCAAHLPELVDKLLNGRRGPLASGGRGPLGRPDPVGRSHTGPPEALPRHQAADPRRPRYPASGQLSSLGRRIVGLRAHRSSLARRPKRRVRRASQGRPIGILSGSLGRRRLRARG